MIIRVTTAALAALWLLSCLGCAAETPELAVRKRWNQLIASALSSDTEAGLQVFDPAYVSRQGPEVVKQRLTGFGDVLRAGRIKAADLRIDKVTIGPDGKTAQVNHSMRTGDGQWLAQAPFGTWVAVDKTWYVTWSDAEASQ